MIKKILLSIGGTPYTTVAIERAVQLAKRFDAEITGVIVINPDRRKNIGSEPKEREPVNARIVVTKDRVEQAVSAFETACSAEGIRYKVKQKEKQTANQLISLSRYHDLMIFGLRAIFEYDVSSEQPEDTLARLLSAGMGPIIAVSDKVRSIGKVLIAYDGSMESAKTMKRFVQLRLWSDAMLKIVTFHKSEDKARQLLYDASEYCRAHGFHVEREYNPGFPKDLLISMAHLWQADMIVLASTEQSLLMKRILRETTLHIIRDADIPLFLGR